MAPIPTDSPDPEVLRSLAMGSAPRELAKERFIPVLPPIAALLDAPGLQRGTTVLLDGSTCPGVTSLALALLVAASEEGMWCSVLGLPTLGLVAADELGVCLERLVLVPGVAGREAMFLATLLEACDIVCAALTRPLSSGDARRLVARARERRGVLIVLSAKGATRPMLRRLWPEASDLTMTVTGGHFVGLEEEGRISARLVEVALSRRRAAPIEHRVRLWLPAKDGGVALQVDATGNTSLFPSVLIPKAMAPSR